MEIIGVGILIIIWAMQVAWIARVASDRGRSVIVWTLIGGAAGIGGLLASRELIERTIEPTGGNAGLAITMMTPLAFLIIPMAALAVGLGKTAAHASQRRIWRVHSTKRGGGRLSFGRDRLEIVWSDGTDQIQLDQIKRAEPDGECVRLAWADSEHILMPLEMPDTRPGRQAQARALAAQIAAAGGISAH